MEAHRRSTLGAAGIILDDADGGAGARELPLFSGVLHYWRVDRADWRACLAAMREIGFAMVHVPVPWSVHERGPGSYVWRQERDLGGFLDLLAEMGMHAVLEPGPVIGAELPGGGVPARILDDAALLARTARGAPAWVTAVPQMMTVPCLAASALREQVLAWFAAVAEIAAPRLVPNGPVAAVHLGRHADLVAQLGPFEYGYQPDALRLWQELEGGEPPRQWSAEDGARMAAWMQCREVGMRRDLVWLSGALDQVGLREVVRLVDLPWSLPGAFDIAALERALGGEVAVGMRVGHRPAVPAALHRRALYLTGSARLPVFGQVSVGGPTLGVPVPVDAAQRAVLGVLAAGARGVGLHLLAECSGWYGAPVSELGEAQQAAEWLTRVLAALREVSWTTLRRHTPVAVMVGRAEQRFAAASSAAGALGSLLEGLLPPGTNDRASLARDLDAAASRRWTEAAIDALELAQIPYRVVDEGCAPEAFAGVRAVIAPTLRRVDRGAWQRLHELARGGAVVIAGPERPRCDERGRELGDDAALPARAGLMRTASLEDPEGLADDLAEVAGELSELWLTAEQGEVDCSLFSDPSGAPRVLFVSNRRAAAVVADVLVPAGVALEDAITGETLRPGRDGVVDVRLEPLQIAMLLVR